jgi:pyridoxamine 5'-phosphate oxidase
MNRDLHNYRQSYEAGVLDIAHTKAHPMDQFTLWFKEVEAAGGVTEPNAMTLATLDAQGFPKARIVLLKEYNNEGFVFYTNYESEKGQSIAQHPQVGLSFFWPNLERQVIIKGTVEKVPEAQSDAYFMSRPKESQLGALVSNQSCVLEDRSILEDKMQSLVAQFENEDIQRPKHWGGYFVQPTMIEFWQGRPSRLHDRIRYGLQENQWIKERLAP